MLRLALVLALTASSLGLATGCKSLEEKVCSHLGGFVDDGNYSEAECQGDINRVKERCTNAETVLECLLEKSTEDELDSCNSLCERAEAAE